MKLRKVIAGLAAATIATSAMAACAFAVDAQGADGEALIAFSSSDWTAQYWADGAEWASVNDGAIITGDGSYSVTVTANTSYESEETGEMVTEPGANGLAFAALQVVNGETLFPGMIITIDSVEVDGSAVALTGTPYTSSDDQVTTRVNLHNAWVSALPDDARTIDGLAADATAVPLSADIGEWSTLTVNFTVSGAGAAGTDAPAADAGKDSPDTGVEGVAAVAGLAVVAAGAVVLSKKRK